MVEPLSVASGVAGIITLNSAVVAAGYKYIDAVRSAPKEIKDLMREICFLNTIVSQLATHTLSTDSGSHPALVALDDEHVFQECEATFWPYKGVSAAASSPTTVMEQETVSKFGRGQ
jgi:hypothetical protein